jgi:hypothetical protein
MERSMMMMRVRPFSTLVGGDDNSPPIKCDAEIVGNEYEIRFGPGIHRIPTRELGADEFGPFALVEALSRPVGHGFVLTVEAEPPDEFIPDDGPGCSISLSHPRSPELFEAALRAQNIDPAQVNLLVPRDFSIRIHFDSSGTKNGVGIGRVISPEAERVSRLLH